MTPMDLERPFITEENEKLIKRKGGGVGFEGLEVISVGEKSMLGETFITYIQKHTSFFFFRLIIKEHNNF